MNFRCDCGVHILKVEDEDFEGVKGLSFSIYDIYSEKGIKYKKPKLISDVIIMNNAKPKEYDRLVDFIKKHSIPKSLRKIYKI